MSKFIFSWKFDRAINHLFAVLIKYSVAILLLFGLRIPQARSDTPPLLCQNKIAGVWDFGQAPYGCDIGQFIQPQFVEKNFSPLIYNHQGSPDEPLRYGEAMYVTLKTLAAYYLQQREPNVNPATLANWVRLILTTAHQESYWSHFRRIDNRITLVRGDSGHGHGLMQLDDRWHYLALLDGVGSNLTKNLVYAMDLLYLSWHKSISAPCILNASDWEARARSTYSAYNGGPAQICRWTHEDSIWRQNDQAFKEKWDTQEWLPFAQNSVLLEIDAACFIEQGYDCAPVRRLQPGVGLTTKQLYQLETGHYCVFTNDRLHCVEQVTDALCLRNLTPYSFVKEIKLTNKDLGQTQITYLNRHTFCQKYIIALHPVGQTIRVNKSINIRQEPGGVILGVAKASTVFQVLDFSLTLASGQKRYYKIRQQSIEGYIYGGSENDYASWTIATDQSPAQQFIFSPGQTIKIAAPNGINLRQTPAGTHVTLVPHDYQTQIIERVIQNVTNRIYYEILFQGEQGYIYGGQIQPQYTLTYWTQLVTEDDGPRQGIAASNFWHLYLRPCANLTCAATRLVIIGGKWETYCKNKSWCDLERDVVDITNSTSQMYQIQLKRTGAQGWIEKHYISTDENS